MIRKNYNAASEELKRQKKRDISRNKRKQQKSHSDAALASTSGGPRSADPQTNGRPDGGSTNTGNRRNSNTDDGEYGSSINRNGRKSKVHQRQPINDPRKLGPRSVYFDPEFNPTGQAPPGWKNYTYPLKYPYSGYVVLLDVREIPLPEGPVPKYFKFYHSHSSGGGGTAGAEIEAAATAGGGNVEHSSQVVFEAAENVTDPTAQAVRSGLVPTALLRKNKKQKQQQQQQSAKKRTSEQVEQLGDAGGEANDGAKKVRLETVEDDGLF